MRAVSRRDRSDCRFLSRDIKSTSVRHGSKCGGRVGGEVGREGVGVEGNDIMW